MTVEVTRCERNDWCIKGARHPGICVAAEQRDLAVFKGSDPKPVKQPKKGRR